MNEEKTPTIEAKAKKNSAKETVGLWLSVSEAAKLGGVTTKTIRRGIKDGLKYKIKSNRYLINFPVLVKYLNRNLKLKNKLKSEGIGQYIKEWRLE
jgi:hypothetical protein